MIVVRVRCLARNENPMQLSVWKSSFHHSVPALTEARSCPGMTNTYAQIQLVGKIAEKIITKLALWS